MNFSINSHGQDCNISTQYIATLILHKKSGLNKGVVVLTSFVFRGEYQGLQNNELKYKNTDSIVRVHTRMQP